MTIEEKRRELFELAVIERMKQSGFLEVEIRVECLTRLDDDYLDSSVDAYWHFWNAALDAVVIEFPESCAWESLDSAMQFVFLTYEAGDTGPDSVELCRRNDCIKAIESTGLGLKVKS